MRLDCPTCDRVLYNRRLTRCGFCGAAIPEALRFSPEEIATLNRKMAELEEAERKRKLAEEQARNEANNSGGDIAIMMGAMIGVS